MFLPMEDLTNLDSLNPKRLKNLKSKYKFNIILDNKNETSNLDIGVVLASKNYHKGALIGHVSNGGGTLPLNDNFSVRFIANEKFTEIELICTGGKPKYQNWQKVKKVVEKQTVIKKVDKTPASKDDYKMGKGKTI